MNRALSQSHLPAAHWHSEVWPDTVDVERRTPNRPELETIKGPAAGVVMRSEVGGEIGVPVMTHVNAVCDVGRSTRQCVTTQIVANKASIRGSVSD